MSLYAYNHEGVKVRATKGGIGFNDHGLTIPMIPKCGLIKLHHWAHHKGFQGDTLKEPETEWHRGWKMRFDPYVEVDMGARRADVRLPSGLVIEFQNSAVTAEEITDREEFYGAMVWVINGKKFLKNLVIGEGKPSRDTEWDGDYAHTVYYPSRRISPPGRIPFYWNWPHQSWNRSERRLVIDLTGGQMLVMELHTDIEDGDGNIVSYEDFVSWTKSWKNPKQTTKKSPITLPIKTPIPLELPPIEEMFQPLAMTA